MDINIPQTSNHCAHYNSHPQSWKTLERRKGEHIKENQSDREGEIEAEQKGEKENGANELDKEEFLNLSGEYAQNTNRTESKACRMTLAKTHQRNSPLPVAPQLPFPTDISTASTEPVITP